MRTRSYWFVVVTAVVGWLATVATPVSAEWFADLFAGRAFTARQDVDDRSIVGGLRITQTVENETFDNSVVYGGRLGYWFGGVPYVGLGLDGSHFEPDLPAQRRNAVLRPDVFGFSGPIRTTRLNISVTALSFDVMFRYPLLPSKDVPGGRLQPYLTAGPAIFFSDLTDPDGNFGAGRQSDSKTTVISARQGPRAGARGARHVYLDDAGWS
jgi:hypothetical protein